MRPRVLAAVPPLVLAASYGILAAYHGRLWLWGTVVHESGRYSLLETTLYASHFFGHVPVYLVLAAVTVGSWSMLAGRDEPPASTRRLLALGLALSGLLAVAMVLAITWFGADDTLRFVLQQRQRAAGAEPGGAWALHLPSTELQLALIPLAVAATTWWFAGELRPRRRGLGLLLAAVTAILGMSLVTGGLGQLLTVWGRPRYLAHSVRELATFPLLYYPIPLVVWLEGLAPTRPRRLQDRRLSWLLAALVLAFTVGFAVQVVVSLTAGIDTMAQRPPFAGDRPLGIPYLLATHYFEHVLDATFFVLVTLLLEGLWRRATATRS